MFSMMGLLMGDSKKEFGSKRSWPNRDATLIFYRRD
jgi:hypothetical protein